jgi:hypothetical protein
MVTQQLPDEQSAQRLAQANLFRLRRQWDDAMTCCMQVLYHEPDNWRAHALLGDIYAAMDRPEEAIQWYCMTLDIRPDTGSVREKLSTLVNSRRREIVSSLDATGSFRTVAPRGGILARLTALFTTSERRRLAVGGAIAVAAVSGIVLLFASHPTASPASPSAPVFTLGSQATNTGIVLQPVSSTQDKTASPQNVTVVPTPAAQPDPAPAAASAQTAPAAGQIKDINDQALTTDLASDAGLKADGIDVSDAQLDPSANTITVTFLSSGPTTPTAQARDMRDAASVARAALTESATAASVTARCLNQPSGTSAQGPVLSFVGSVARTAVTGTAVDPASMTQQQLQQLFTTVWWAPGLAPTSGP